MKRTVTTGLVLILFMCMSAFATDTRTLVMGENNTILVDDANMWEFPGRTFNYPNIAVGEFGGNDFYNFGMNWKIGEDNPWVMGTYFSTASQPLPSAFDGTDYGNFTFIDDTHNRNIDLFYGRPLGGKNFGMRLGYYSIAYEDTDTLGLGKESTYLINLAFGLTDPGGSWDVAAHAQLGGWTDEDGDGVAETEADGYTLFGVTGRYFWIQNPTMTLVPHVAVAFGKRGEKDNLEDMGIPDPSTNDFNTESKGTAFELGLGVNCTPASNVLAVADFGFSYEKIQTDVAWTTTFAGTAGTSEMTETRTFLPFWKIGLEAEVFKWMDVRMGAVSNWTSEKTTWPTTFEEKEKFAENTTYLGFGFHWGRLHVDTYTDPEMFLEGLDFINGNGNTDMNFRISALYEMFN